MRTEGYGFGADGGGHGYNTRRTNADVRRRVLLATGDPRERTADGEPIPLFMSNVYNIVDGSNPDIVGWSADGDTFIVHDAAAFARNILPQHFRHSNFSSFVRQLNFYGFRSSSHRDERDPRKRSWEFRHPMFRRGGRELLSRIRRKTYSETAAIAVRGDISNLQQDVEELRSGTDELLQTMDLLKRSTLLFVKNSRKRGRSTAAGMIPSPGAKMDAMAETEGGAGGGKWRQELDTAVASSGPVAVEPVPHAALDEGVAQLGASRGGGGLPADGREQGADGAKARRRGPPPLMPPTPGAQTTLPSGGGETEAAGRAMPPPAVPALREGLVSELWGQATDGEGRVGGDLEIELTPDDLAWLDAQTRWEGQ